MAKMITVDRGGIAKIIPETKLEEYQAQGFKKIEASTTKKPADKPADK